MKISRKMLAVAATGLALFLGGVAGAQGYPVHNGGLTVDGATPGTVPTYSAGDARHITGSGFMPGATVTLTIESVPLTLGTAVADGAGNIDATVTIPADFPSGSHTLKATGPAPDGGVLVLAQAVQVTGSATAATGGGGTVTTIAGAPPGNLARTGRDLQPLALTGAGVVLAGGGLVFVASRRRQHTS